MGPQGPAGVSGYTTVRNTQPITAPEGHVVATCPAGTMVIGGGFEWSSPSPLHIAANVPISANQWAVKYGGFSGAPGTWSFTTVAICARVSP
jgi:hypothetical protein